MHNWGDDSVDWKGINEAAEFIGTNLRRWGRVGVRDWKEKYGTVRVYCDLGWDSLHSLVRPERVGWRYPPGLWVKDWRYMIKLDHPLNWLILPYHKWLYRYLYARAVRRWPHLACEILHGADFRELLLGIPHSCRRKKKEDEYNGNTEEIQSGVTGGE